MSFKRIYQKMYYQFFKRHYYGITATSRVLPNFLIIGGVRCGTTSLYYDICQHPSVETAAYDEIGFFDDNYHLGQDWYRSLFPTKRKMENIKQVTGYSITGEDTPFYIWNSDVVKRIADMLPNIKLIAILRNPIDRAYSNYHLGIREGIEKRSFSDVVKNEIDFINMRKQENIELTNNDYKKSYLAKGIYVEQLKKWYKIFRKEQLCVISTEDFSDNPNQTLKKIFNFLKIPDYSIKEFEEKKKSEYSEMNNSTRVEIEKFFEVYNEQLYQLIGQKFNWN
jgi:hypothetical protein